MRAKWRMTTYRIAPPKQTSPRNLAKAKTSVAVAHPLTAIQTAPVVVQTAITVVKAVMTSRARTLTRKTTLTRDKTKMNPRLSALPRSKKTSIRLSKGLSLRRWTGPSSSLPMIWTQTSMRTLFIHRQRRTTTFWSSVSRGVARSYGKQSCSWFTLSCICQC